MRLEDLFESDSTSGQGTFAAAKLSKESQDVVAKFIRDNEIPNPVRIAKLHCTLIHSANTLRGYKAAGKYDKPIRADVSRLEVWKPKGKTNSVLVMKLKSPGLTARHHELMDEYPEAVYKFPSYRTHLTLSYDVGELTTADIPDFKTTLYFDKEYSTPLQANKNWAKENTRKGK